MQITCGDDAARILLNVIESTPVETVNSKINRSYGCVSRVGEKGVHQDVGTGAVTEVMAVSLPVLQPKPPIPDSSDMDTSEQQWIKEIQTRLDSLYQGYSPVPIRLLGRHQVPKKFNAETDSSHRRVEYILPLEFLKHADYGDKTYDYARDHLPTFGENHKHSIERQEYDSRNAAAFFGFLHILKKTMQSLTTQIVKLDVSNTAAVEEKACSERKLKNQQSKKNHKKGKKRGRGGRGTSSQESGTNDMAVGVEQETVNHHTSDVSNPECVPKSQPTKKRKEKHVLMRKRFHNFTPKLMAHEYMAFRRLDRMYLRSTLRFESDENQMPFLVLSLNGDLFLTGQVPRLIGVLIAIVNRMVDAEFIDMVFDERYPDLVPTPSAPTSGMVAGEAYYMSWEGKAKAILSPRRTSRYESGFNNDFTLGRVQEWSKIVQATIAQEWINGDKPESSSSWRNAVVQDWFEQVLNPWATQANIQLKQYRIWKQQDPITVNNSSKPDVLVEDNADESVPELYRKVLLYLREADSR